jgi:protein TonB
MNNKKQGHNKKQEQEGKLRYLFLTLLFSLLLHILGVIGLWLHENYLKKEEKNVAASEPIKIKILKLPKDDLNKAIVETPLAKTKPPETYDYLGENDHQTKKEKKVKHLVITKALSPGQTKDKKDNKKPDEKNNSKPPQEAQNKKPQQNLKEKPSFFMPEGRNEYEKFLNRTLDQVSENYKSGYTDSPDKDMEEGDSLDLNTKEFKYISYFTSLRKAIELVWVYPMEAAQKGIQGKVQLRFTIQENGRVSEVSVVRSSGHSMLDQAILEAIKLASPFSPLPQGWHKEHLTITGSFNYVLTGYASY